MTELEELRAKLSQVERERNSAALDCQVMLGIIFLVLMFNIISEAFQ